MEKIICLVLLYWITSVVSMMSFWTDQKLPEGSIYLLYEFFLSPILYPFWAFCELSKMKTLDKEAAILIHGFIFTVLMITILTAF
jgi:hypothetical protein